MNKRQRKKEILEEVYLTLNISFTVSPQDKISFQTIKSTTGKYCSENECSQVRIEFSDLKLRPFLYSTIYQTAPNESTSSS